MVNARTRYKREDYNNLIVKECHNRDYEYLGHVEPWSGVATKLKLRCKKDNNTWSTTVVSSFLNGHGCPQCKARNLVEINSSSIEDSTRLFMSSGKFLDGSQFFRNVNKSGKNDAWYYTCPTCSMDEYVEADLCTGKFYSSRTNLTSGWVRCRCSKNFHWSQSQREYQINKENSKDGLGIELAGWKQPYKNCRSIVTLRCPIHGEWDVRVGDFLGQARHRCPDCSVTGYNSSKDGYIYVLEACGRHGFTGYGISNKPENRILQHSRSLKRDGMYIERYEVFKTGGHSALSIEGEIKRVFERNPQSVKGFKTEATYKENYESLVAFVKRQEDIVPYLTEECLQRLDEQVEREVLSENDNNFDIPEEY